MSQSLHLTTRGSVLEIVLDRPKANAIDAKTSHEMGEVFSAFVMILTYVSRLLQVQVNAFSLQDGI